jgi:predicted MFS family arabinose efflux permease
MLWSVCFLNYADRQAIFSVFPPIRNELGLTSFQLGIVASSFMWMYALAGPFAGWVADKISPRTVVLAALLFWSLITAMTALCQGYSALVVVRTLGGLGEAFYFPAAMALIGAVHGTATRSRAMAVHQSSVYAGTIGGGALSGAIAQTHGWRSSFVLFGMLGIGLACLLIVSMRRPASPQKRAPALNFLPGVKSVLSSPRVVVTIIVFMGANFVAIVFLTWLPTFLYDKFQMSLAAAGFSSTAYLQIASVAGVLSGGALADHLASRLTGGRQIIQAIGLFCGVPFIFLTGWSLTLTGLLIGMIGFGFFKGIYDANIWASLYDVIPAETRGVSAGVMNSLGWLGGGFAPLLIAIAAQRFGLSVCLSATSVIYLMLALLLLLLARKMPAQPQDLACTTPEVSPQR